MTTDQIMAFIKTHYPPSRTWATAIFRNWIDWCLGQGFLAYVIDEVGYVCGLGIAHPIMKGEHEDTLDHEGNVIYIDLAIGTEPGALQILVCTMLKRFGHREFVAWRQSSLDKHKFYSLASFRRNVLRMKTITNPLLAGGN